MSPADSYRRKAAELRTKAAQEMNERLATEWNHLARCYVRLAEQAEENSLQDVWVEVGPKTALDSGGA